MIPSGGALDFIGVEHIAAVVAVDSAVVLMASQTAHFPVSSWVGSVLL